jgi:hypothetical protein
VKATTVAGMGTLTVILTEPSTSGWMYINLYTASGGEIQVGIGDKIMRCLALTMQWVTGFHRTVRHGRLNRPGTTGGLGLRGCPGTWPVFLGVSRATGCLTY